MNRLNEVKTAKDDIRIGLFVLTYNRSGMLKKMLNSICEQRFENFKCVILDNGSWDDTASVVQHMRLDARFEWAPWPAAEPGDNFRRAIGLGLEQFDWFAMLHDDDWLEPDWLESAWGAAIAHPQSAFVSVNARTVTQDGAVGERTWYPDLAPGKVVRLPDRESVARWMFRYGSIHFPSILYRAACFHGWDFSEPFGKYSDQYLLLEMVGRGGCVVVGNPAYCYRVHSGQDSFAFDEHLAMALHLYVENCVKFGFNLIKITERNNSLIRNFRMFAKNRNGYLLFELFVFCARNRILFIGIGMIKAIFVDFIHGFAKLISVDRPEK